MKNQMEILAKVSKNVLLRDIVLRRSKFHSSVSHQVEPGKAESTAEILSVNSYDNDQLEVLIKFNLSAYAKGQTKMAFKIEAEFLAIYSLEKISDYEEEEILCFANHNAVFNMWPYWREYVNDIVSRMHIWPTLVIPVFRINDMNSVVKPLSDNK